MFFLSAKEWISSALLVSREFCTSLSLLWTVLLMLLHAVLDTLMGLMNAMYSSRSPWISSSFSSNQSWCLRDMGFWQMYRNIVAKDCLVLFRIIWTELHCILTVAHITDIACYTLSCFSLETPSLFGAFLPCGRPAGSIVRFLLLQRFNVRSCCWEPHLFNLSVESWFICLLFWCSDGLEVLHADWITCMIMNDSST